jgi:hypothetical protein
MVSKMALWVLIDETHKNYNNDILTYEHAMIYLNAYEKVAVVGPEKSRQSILDRIERVRGWITDAHEGRDPQ